MSINTPSELKYTKDHEWTKVEGDVVTIGITDYAQSQLGDIVFVELPEAGTEVEKGNAFGVVESIKSVSDLYSPLSGEIIEINEALEDSPELCNSEPYSSWIIKIKFTKSEEIEALLGPEDYQKLCE
jgi:glycine cleavage system H protein